MFGARGWVRNGLIHHFKLDETTGTIGKNRANRAFDANFQNTQDGDWVSAVVGNGIELDGADERGDAGDPSDVSNLTQFSAMIWVIPKSIGTRQCFFGKCGTDTANQEFQINVQVSGLPRVKMNNPVDDTNVTGTTTLVVDNQYHLGIDYDGSRVAIRVNGVAEATQARTEDNGNTSREIVIGARDNDTVFANAIHDEARIYNRKLSDSEWDALASGRF